jgi:hypothetical protein
MLFSQSDRDSFDLSRHSCRVGVALVVAIVAVGLVPSCADCFFSIRGHVVECGTTSPIPNVIITVNADSGLHEGPYPGTFTTGNTGDFVVTNGSSEACGAVQTLTFTKEGFSPLALQVTGEADAPPIDLCMTRMPSP